MRTHVPAALTAALLVAGLAAAGCGSDDEPEPAARPAPATTTVAAGDEVAGTFERKVTSADIERTDARRGELPPGQVKPKPHTAQLVLTATGLKLIEVGTDPPFQIEQDMTVADGTLRIGAYVHPERGSFCGPETPQNATYSYEVVGAVLRLKAVSDECADRDSILSGDWQRQG